LSITVIVPGRRVLSAKAKVTLRRRAAIDEELTLVGVAVGVDAVAAADGGVGLPERAVVPPGGGGHVGAVLADAAVAAGEHQGADAGDALGEGGGEAAGDDLVGIELEGAGGGPAVERGVLEREGDAVAGGEAEIEGERRRNRGRFPSASPGG
jgi:hypothetical protein